LYDVDFYRACAARLNPSGAMTLHLASPVAHPDRIRNGMAALRAAFPIVVPYLVSIPLYGGLWMMACASASLNPSYLTPLEADRRISQRGIRDLRYYNGDVHRAAMAMPNFVRDLVQAAA
jgi:spermidine synthase